MKNLLFVALVGSSILVPTITNAKPRNYHPYIGIEAIQTNLNFKSGYGDGVFKKNPQDYSIFAGLNFYKFLGLELGCEYQPSKGKNVTLTSGQSVPGLAPLGTGEFAVMSSTYKISHPYLGLFAETSTRGWNTKFIFQGLIGASVSHVNAQDTYISDEFGPANITRYFKQTKVLPMVKLSAIGCVTDHFGIRLSVNYRNTSAFKINADAGQQQIKLKDTWGIGLGVLYLFC